MLNPFQITPNDVHSILSRHLLADGLDMVLDLEKSRTPYLRDAKSGRDFLDFFTFFASNPLGMNHPALADDEYFVSRLGKVAINKPSNSDVYTEEMAEFVHHFSTIGIPEYLSKSFFISGGALAVENAMKVAFDWKVQKNFQKGYRQERGLQVLHFEKAFHGRSGYTLSVTNTLPDKVKYFPKFSWPRVMSPAASFPLTDENQRTVAEAEQLAIAQAERYFEQHKDDIACILIEPIQAEGGDRHFRLEFHLALRELADKHETLLIYDEVQTGVGLTGKFWAHEHFVKPDIIAFGKKAQVCGILAGSRIDDVPTNCFNVSSRINSTWGGNLVDMVRFGKILQVIEHEDLIKNAANIGAYLLSHLENWASEDIYITNARGKGLMCAIDLPDARSRNAVVKECYQNGLMILGCGEKTIRFRPPLTIANEHIDEGIHILKKSVKAAKEKYPAAEASK